MGGERAPLIFRRLTLNIKTVAVPLLGHAHRRLANRRRSLGTNRSQTTPPRPRLGPRPTRPPPPLVPPRLQSRRRPRPPRRQRCPRPPPPRRISPAPPLSLEKITYNPATASVLYRSTPHWRTRRNFEVWTAPNFISTLLAHLPAKGSPQVRYYGWYSNKSRGLRAAAHASALAAAQASASATTTDPTAAPTTPPTANARTANAHTANAHTANAHTTDAPTANAPVVPFGAPNPPPRRRRRIAWRELIKHVWGVDPLKCPLCPGQLRPIAVVKKTTEIATLLAALNLPRTHQHPWAHGPPAPTGTVVVDAPTRPYDQRHPSADALEPA